MILPVFGIPSSYDEIVRRLRKLGIVPTGNKDVDRNKLISAVKKQAEKVAEKQEIEKNKEDDLRQKGLEKLEEERKGAEILGLYNRALLGI